MHLEADLNSVLAYAPVHLSIYDLIVEKGTPLEMLLRSGLLTSLDESQKEELWLYARKVLRKNGYVDYEISNFSKGGHKSLHNQCYWNLEPYLGLGAGAVSLFLAQKEGEIQAIRRINGSIFSYQRGEGKALQWINPGEFLFEHFLVGWRTRKGVKKRTIARRFGKDVQERLSFLLHENFQEGVEETIEAWKLGERDFLNSFLLRWEEIFWLEEWRDIKILGY